MTIKDYNTILDYYVIFKKYYFKAKSELSQSRKLVILKELRRIRSVLIEFDKMMEQKTIIINNKMLNI